MTRLNDLTGVWFVYDGECPICHYAAHALRIKEHYGSLHLLDARVAGDHPLMAAINQQTISLDEGMVIYADGKLMYGREALMFMAKFGEPMGWFNQANRLLFRSKWVANRLYPVMRAVRNALIKQRGVAPIDNLEVAANPTFFPIFGKHWNELPPVIKKHYANKPYSQDVTVVDGKMEVSYRSAMAVLKPFYRLLGTVPVENQSDVRVSVRFESSLFDKSFRFNRSFYFAGKRPYSFLSSMTQTEGDRVVEVMKFGICWKMQYGWDGEKVTLSHKGYALKLGKWFLPLPITWLLGRGDAYEKPVDDDHFDMRVDMTHWLFGNIYSYQGRFKVVRVP